MTDKERIERLERMVKTLADTCQDLCSIVNTGSYQYDLSAVRIALTNVAAFDGEDTRRGVQSDE